MSVDAAPPEPAAHHEMPQALAAEVAWRLRQGGMAHLFRLGTMDCINRIFAAGIEAGQARRFPPPPPVQEPQPAGPLTAREAEVLQAFAAGHDGHRGVGEYLGCRHTTVHSHITSVRIKLGARTTAHAVHVAHRLGLIT